MTVMLSFSLYVALSVDDVTDETVGAVVSITNVLTLNALLAFNAESVTVMVQLYDPSLKVPNEIELVPLSADVSPGEQEEPP